MTDEEADDNPRFQDAGPCPRCGGEVGMDPACPGYPGLWNGKPTILVCSQGCSNATEYLCLSESCTWWYREPNNRTDKIAMGERPDWPLMAGW